MRTTLLACTALLGACVTPPNPTPKTPTNTPTNTTAGAPSSPSAPQAAVPRTDISSAILFTATLGSVDAIMDQGVAYVRPHLPQPLQNMVQPAMLRAQFFKAIKLPQLEQLIETDRPLAIAVADPEAYQGVGKLGPTIIAVPTRDAAAMGNVIATLADQHKRTSWGDHLFTFDGDNVWMRPAEGYALFAAHEQLIGGAEAVLRPLLKGAPAGAVARADIMMSTIYARYGGKIAKTQRKLRRKARRKPQLAGVLRMLERWVAYFKSTQKVTLTASLGSGSIRLATSIAASESGAFPAYLAKQTPGPAWGAKLLPSDSAVVYLTRQNPKVLLEELDGNIDLLRGLVKPYMPEGALRAFRDATREATKHFSGEAAVAAWVNADGGLGMATVSKVRDAAAARAGMQKLFQLVSRQLKQVMDRLPPPLKKELKGFSVGLKVRPAAVAAGVKGDVIELKIRWPRLKNRAARRRLLKLRRQLAQVLGRRFTIATATVGGVYILTMGKDYRGRMAQIAKVARGGAGGGMEKPIAAAFGSRRITSAVYIPVVVMAEQAMRFVERLMPIPAQMKTVFQQVLPPPGTAVPVMAWVEPDGPKLTVNVDLSAELVAIVARSTMAFVVGRRPVP